MTERRGHFRRPRGFRRTEVLRHLSVPETPGVPNALIPNLSLIVLRHQDPDLGFADLLGLRI